MHCTRNLKLILISDINCNLILDSHPLFLPIKPFIVSIHCLTKGESILHFRCEWRNMSSRNEER